MNTEPGEREETPNLTERDKTRFLERGFTVVENAGHSLRFIKRDDARQAISIKWEDLPALRELITLALDDGPMIIGPDISGQSAKNAATRMRDLCVAKVRESKYYDRGEGLEDEDPHSDNNPDYIRAAIDERLEDVAHDLESLTLDGEKEQTRS